MERYRLERILGLGGMSTVYLATDLHLQKKWAIKRIHRRVGGEGGALQWASLKTEAAILKKLDHPGLPRVVDLIEEEQSLTLVMDYIEGETLAHFLRRKKTAKEGEVRQWMLQLAEILDYLHRQTPPIVYRDLKPSNIMLCPNGKLMLLDFGIAEEKQASAQAAKACGTEGYAAPEQRIGSKVNQRSDFYALGMVAVCALTGMSPSQIPMHISFFWLRRRRPRISRGLCMILKRCLDPDSTKRFSTAQELARKLQGKRPVERTRTGSTGRLAFLILLLLAEVLTAAGRQERSGQVALQQMRTEQEDAGIYLTQGKEILFSDRQQEPFRTRVYQAQSVFAKAKTEYEGSKTMEPDLQEQIESYLRLCDFFIAYVFPDRGLQEPENGCYPDLVQDIGRCLETWEEPLAEGEAQIQLLFLQNMVELLREYRQGFAAAGVSLEQLEDLLNRMAEQAGRISVQRQQLLTWRNTLLGEIETCRDACEKTYQTVGKWKEAMDV